MTDVTVTMKSRHYDFQDGFSLAISLVRDVLGYSSADSVFVEENHENRIFCFQDARLKVKV